MTIRVKICGLKTDDAMRAAMNRAGMNIVVAPEGKAEKEGKTE